MRYYKFWKTTIVGLLMMSYAYYISHTTNEITLFTSFDFWVVCVNAVLGFILLFTGDKYIDVIINIIIDKIKNLFNLK